tara:strand:- start:6638 stop:7234 length:597 start_codon:yes stop_codon:yes gene_type:complete
MMTSTKSISANTKERLFREIVEFMLNGFNQDQLSPLLKQHLPTMFDAPCFGTIASFVETYLNGPSEKALWLRTVAAYKPSFPPEHSLSDVEEEVQSWLAANLRDVESSIGDVSQVVNAPDRLFLIQGRCFGDDDDTCALIHASTVDVAEALFLKEHLNITSDESGLIDESDDQGDPAYFIIYREDISGVALDFARSQV